MITLPAPFARALPLKLLKAVRAHAVFSGPYRDVVVPMEGPGADAALTWGPDWMAHFLREVFPAFPGAFVDIGANVGQTALSFLWASPPDTSYIGVEPNLDCAYFLKALLGSNAAVAASVFPGALAGELGLARLFVQTYSRFDTAATLIGDLRPGRSFNEVLVPSITGDRLLRELGTDPAGIIKIDVEGGELEVLSGLAETLRVVKPLILCEVLLTAKNQATEFNQQRDEATLKIVKDAGYRVFHVVKPPDERRVEELKEIDSFPVGHWSPEIAHQCDYLFATDAHVERLKHRGSNVTSLGATNPRID